MNNNIPEIEDLIKKFSKLPGLGPNLLKEYFKINYNKENMIKPFS